MNEERRVSGGEDERDKRENEGSERESEREK